MKVVRLGLGVLLAVTGFASAALAAGTAGRTFVSGKGLDTNPCTLASPCRTFAAAMAQTGSGGEVVVLDSAGYGAFTISQAVTISAPEGVYAGITVDAGDGIDVNAGASDVVTVRGLTVTGPGPAGGAGILFNSGAALHVENCEVREFNAGIRLGAASLAFIKDTVVKDSNDGILLIGNRGNSLTVMDHVTVNNNSTGIDVQSAANGLLVQAEIRDSTISGNHAQGVIATGLNGGKAIIDLKRCLITNGGTGLQANTDGASSGAMSISHCLISHSTTGFSITGGQIVTFSNNTIIGNGPNVGSLTPNASQ